MHKSISLYNNSSVYLCTTNPPFTPSTGGYVYLIFWKGRMGRVLCKFIYLKVVVY